jgi:cobyrinic acid a,c-diamide synthase
MERSSLIQHARTRLSSQQLGIENDPELESIEVHLVVCEECQERAMQLDRTLEVLRTTLKAAQRSSKTKKPIVMTARTF